MPEPVQSSWADEIEDNDSSVLPPPSEKIKGDIKTVTEFLFNEVRPIAVVDQHALQEVFAVF